MEKLPFLVVASVLMTLSPVLSFQTRNALKSRVAVNFDRQSHLLEVGPIARRSLPLHLPADFKVISYNIRWRGGEDLRKLIELLKNDPEIGSATVLALQEVDRNKKRTRNTNTVRLLAEGLGMYYAWAAPPSPRADEEEETGVAILSFFPLTDVHRIVLPHKGPGERRRVALGATISLGQKSLRVYSVHSETRVTVDKKLEQMKTALEDLARYPKATPAIVMGDLNTWEQDAVAKTFKLFSAENFHTPFDEEPTFSRRVLFMAIDLKLDWIWLRGLEESDYGIDRRITLSDHWPLWVTLKSKTFGIETN